MEDNKPKGNVHITDLVKKINKFLSNEKPADILIIKAHLLCEYYVNQLIVFREKCSHQELESLTFNQQCYDGEEKTKTTKLIDPLRVKMIS